MNIKIYGLDDCVYCNLILHALKKANLSWEVDTSNLDEFNKLYPGKEYPSVVIDDEFIGGAPALIKYLTEKQLL
jgi:glutaredoxin